MHFWAEPMYIITCGQGIVIWWWIIAQLGWLPNKMLIRSEKKKIFVTHFVTQSIMQLFRNRSSGVGQAPTDTDQIRHGMESKSEGVGKALIPHRHAAHHSNRRHKSRGTPTPPPRTRVADDRRMFSTTEFHFPCSRKSEKENKQNKQFFVFPMQGFCGKS